MAKWQANKGSERQTDRQSQRQTDRQTDRQTGRQTGHTNKWTNKLSQQGARPNGLRLTLRMSDMPWGRSEPRAAFGLGLGFGFLGSGIRNPNRSWQLAFNLCHCWPH